MRYLLDTHAFLWWIEDDPRLSATARAILRDPENTIYLSAASAWEIAIKVQLGRLELAGPLDRFLAQQLAANQILPLAIALEHAVRVFYLPRRHRDPFDRLLIAQALSEGLTLLTADAEIRRYEVSTVW